LCAELAVAAAAEIAIDIIGAGLGASLGAARDISAAAATANSAHKPYYKFVSGLIQAALGGSLDDLSCYDVYNESQGGALLPPIVPSFDNWLIPSGLGAVVTGLAKGLDIHTGTVVNRIRWGGRGVTVETSAGRVQAKAAIVTVPVGPLAAGKPDFQPDLPKPYQTALERQIEMGHTAKIGLMFADGFRLDVPHFNTFVSPNADSTQIPLVQTRAWGHDNFAILIASGTKIAELEKSGDLVHYAREQMRDLFGTKTFNAFRKGVATSWNTSPYSMGAFSHARPGGVPGRKRLAKPIDGRLFFAGEAVSIDQHSSAPGAYTTGKVAAERAISALKTG